MASSRDTIWYEDVERHRQPSLYYLSSEDDPAGPHLIVDWNGPPTDFNDFDYDLMNKFIEMKPIETQDVRVDTKPIESEDQDDEYMGIFNKSKTNKSTSPATLLTENDGAKLHFLTVPPMVNSLLKRFMSQQYKNRPAPIPEETNMEMHTTVACDNTKKTQKKSVTIKKTKSMKREKEAVTHQLLQSQQPQACHKSAQPV